MWQKASLTPAADGLFNDAFYPVPNHLGHRNVYFTIIQVGGQVNTHPAISGLVGDFGIESEQTKAG